MAHNPLLRTASELPLELESPLAAPSPNTTSSQFNTSTCTPIDGVPGAYLVGPLLSPRECTQLIHTTETLGYAPKKSRRQGPAIRTNERLLFEPPREVLNAMAARLRPLLASLPVEQVGQWRLAPGSDFLNARWRMNRYQEGEVFHPHFDTGYELSPERRSLMSLIVYLNDDFAEGETVFFPDGQRRDHMLPGDTDAVEVSIKPQQGMALLFHHFGPLNPRHSGRSPLGGVKYIIRSDVFYEREPLPLAARLFGGDPQLTRVLLLMGPPGAGKSTQLRRLQERLDFAGIDFGHEVRTLRKIELSPDNAPDSADLALITALQHYREARRHRQDQQAGVEQPPLQPSQSDNAPSERRPGGWLSESLTLAILHRALERARLRPGPFRGLVLDGFPRMRAQSIHLEGSAWHLLGVVHLQVPDAERQRRLLNRGLDPLTGAPVSREQLSHEQLAQAVRRPEDSQPSQLARLHDYELDTRPLLEHYAKRGEVLAVDGGLSPEAVTEQVLRQLYPRLLQEARAHFPHALQVRLAGHQTDGMNHARRPESLVFRHDPVETASQAPSLFLKLAPSWGAALNREALFLQSDAARTFGVTVPVCDAYWTLHGEGRLSASAPDTASVHCLITQALPGESLKSRAQRLQQALASAEGPDAALHTEGQLEDLIQGLVDALKRIHSGPALPDTLAPAATRSTEQLLAHAEQRLAQRRVPLRNFSARYGAPLTSWPEVEHLLEQLQAQWKRGLIPDEPLVPVHGDACLPNFFARQVQEAQAPEHEARWFITGCLDLSHAGMADRCWDLSLAAWSVGHNLGEPWAERFLQAYDPLLDRTRLNFYSELRRFLV